MIYQLTDRRIVGPAGDLPVPDGDEITPRLLMLIEGQCEGLGPMLAARIQRLEPGPRFGDNLEVAASFQQQREHLPNRRLGIRNHNALFHTRST